jgi:hypothetical protein
MLMRNVIRSLSVCVALAASLAAHAGVFVSVSIAPPALPVYVAPPMPAPGYFWTPGYWSYADGGYFWVPGTWVMAPTPGLLWTPGYWGWGSGAYLWHGGYWGPHVGFYGGINYGFGYGGVGFHGGEWQGGRYVANTTIINNTTVVNNTTINRTSFNGGSGGVAATPTPAEARAAQEHHVGPSEMQQQHEQAAAKDTTMRASYNHGAPSVAATAKAGQFYGHGVTAAHAGGAASQPEHTQASAPHEQMAHAGGGAPGGAAAPHTPGGQAPHAAYAGAPHGTPGAPRGAPGAPHGAPRPEAHGGGEHAPPHGGGGEEHPHPR